MNCKELETLVTDIARSPVMDAKLRETVYAHTRDCAGCAARLSEAKQLTVGLRALAILDENQKASTTVEANLLNAYRKRAESARQNSATASETSAKMPAAGRNWHLSRWAVAAG